MLWLLHTMEYHKNILIKATHIIAIATKTTRLLQEKLKVKIPIMTTFQSRFGPEEWLQPYTDKTLENLPTEGKKIFLLFVQGLHQICGNIRRNINGRKGKFYGKWRKKFLHSALSE